MLKNFKIETTCNDVFAITDSVKTAVEQSGVQEGIWVGTIPHTTAPPPSRSDHYIFLGPERFRGPSGRNLPPDPDKN